MRVALYARVSTEDQARHGISIEAQLAALHQWAEREGHTVVGEYVDAGISGKKPPTKRPELSRFFRDLENGLQADVLAFCKLDRFFRSVKLYYQAMDVLERHHVAWQAIQEDYETITASGRMKVNIMLSVAENEADRTSERIKTVFEHKIEKGEAITRCQPFGYKLENKKVVQDENAPAARAMFEHFARYGNTFQTREMLIERYGCRLAYESVYRFLQNPIYTGRYRDNPNYCEPIVTQELFDRVQADFSERRKTKKTPTGRIYIFSGLIVCKTCGRKMIANYRNPECVHREQYRCAGHYLKKGCPNAKCVNEYDLEQKLLITLASALKEVQIDTKLRPTNSAAVNREAVKRKLARLKELYIEGDIEKGDYVKQRDKLNAILEKSAPRGSMEWKTLIGENFSKEYAEFTREQKRSFWRSVLDHVTVDQDKSAEVFFIE